MEHEARGPSRTRWQAVWLLNGLIIAVAIALFALVVPSIDPVEIVLVGPALLLGWRRTPLKLIFDVARLVLSAALALLVYHVLVGANGPATPVAWAAALTATTVGGIAGVGLLAAGVSLAGGKVDRRELRLILRYDAPVTAALTCIGLALATLLVTHAGSAWLLLLPAATLTLAHRAHLRERRRRERLDFLSDATSALSLPGDVEDALVDLLARSRDAFRAGMAEIVLLPASDAGPRRTRVAGVVTDAMSALDGAAAAAVRDLVAGGTRVRPAGGAGDSPGAQAYLRAAGVHGPALLAVLEAPDRAVGLLLIANRSEVHRGFGPEDLALLARLAATASVSLAHESLEQDFGRLEQLQTQLEYMAFHDPLTALANRARFIDQVRHALARRNSLVAALFIDLDDFKIVNDSLGHKAGDELLVAVAERLRTCLRPVDTPARLGGDEFAVLIDDAGTMELVIEVADRVLEALSEPFSIADAELVVRASIGVATSQEGIRTAGDLVRNADLAMYRAKGEGKGRVELFRPDMHTRAVQRHELKSELQRAVDADEFVVLFQPVVDLGGGQIAGVEALVRWQHPRLGLIGPETFIPLAEEAGLIDAIGRLVLATACERLAAWRRAGIAGDEFRLSLNLSVREFKSPDIVEGLRETALAAGVPTSAVTLEITESALMEDLEGGVARMALIKAAGFRLALDDFGTGYSSLGHLRDFPIDVLKVAKPFVDHITERAEDAEFLGSILDLARTLSLEVIVEGVETPEQAQLLLRLGAHKVQGFVFSRPVEDRAMSALLTLTPLRGFAEAPPIEPAVPPFGQLTTS